MQADDFSLLVAWEYLYLYNVSRIFRLQLINMTKMYLSSIFYPLIIYYLIKFNKFKNYFYEGVLNGYLSVTD